MSRYSRSKQSPSKKSTPRVPVGQIKTGFSALQKTVALVGSIMSILVATITINRYLNETATPKEVEKPAETKVIYQDNGQATQGQNSVETTVEETLTDSTEATESEAIVTAAETTLETSQAVEAPVTEAEIVAP